MLCLRAVVRSVFAVVDNRTDDMFEDIEELLWNSNTWLALFRGSHQVAPISLARYCQLCSFSVLVLNSFHLELLEKTLRQPGDGLTDP